MNRTEVKTLLAEAAGGGTPDKTVKENHKKISHHHHLLKLNQIFKEVVEQSSIILDPSVIPEGEGMVDG